MRYGRILLLAGCAVSLVVCDRLRGEEQRKRNAKLESLEVENDGGLPLTVWIRALGETSPPDAKQWQTALEVPPNGARSIPLYGFQPFDIEIQVDADTAYLLEGAPLCTQMAECATAPECKWKAKGMRRGPDGQWRWDQSMDTELQLKVDTKKVRILFQLVGNKLPDPIPPPPPPPPKKPH